MRKQIVLLAVSCLSLALSAQQTEWKTTLSHFFDNTEFAGSSYQRPQTMAGLRVAPELALRLDSCHQLTVGVDMLKEYGSAPFLDEIDLTAYYLYEGKPFRFLIGSFPRKGLTDQLPKAFFQDSISYYCPNMTGMWWQFRKQELDASLFLDWTGRQTLTVHEAFFVGGLIDYRKSLFFAKWQGLMFHHAGSELVRGVHENVMNHIALGLDVTTLTPLDTLTLQIGYLGGYERDRNLTADWTFRHGLLAELQAFYCSFGLKSTVYAGAGLMSDYSTRGNTTYWGDPFYRGTFYSRTDVTYDIFNRKNVSLRLMLSQHISEEHVFFEQALLASITFGD